MANSPAQVFAAQLLAGLAQAGAQRVFLAPGARSQALAIAAGQLAEAEAIELTVRLDERGLCFAALGAKNTRCAPAWASPAKSCAAKT